MKKSLVWLRRSLRIRDNKVIEQALKNSEIIMICFVFDTNILAHFPDKSDRRLSFIVNHLELMNQSLGKFDSSIHILYGDPAEEIPKFSAAHKIQEVFVDEDFEPTSITRDDIISRNLENIGVRLTKVLDHLLIHPKKLLKSDNSPFKVFTPMMKALRAALKTEEYSEVNYSLRTRLDDINNVFDKKEVLSRAGYEYVEDELWHPAKATSQFEEFRDQKLDLYHLNRNLLSGGHTSAISPYLRFGALSIRQAFRDSIAREVAPNFVNELIWREFYAYIIYHFPHSVSAEFQQKYQGKIQWRQNEQELEAFLEGKTGFPVVDAGIRQLLQDGWMHNRARMIVASFFTKNLLMDWRIGERFFSQYLMDYDLASNVGGWQWTASTGTDAQPFFRVFNPFHQSKDYDAEGDYIKKYVPELKDIKPDKLHDPDFLMNHKILGYVQPIVDYKKTREEAISTFKSIEQ
ncbi:MAG: deoxyribodipyrimidine photo-lyase [Rickettsiaceae bacterium]|nr:deoxyribodipyrimidine photo-lyase [Rickettsiaceae bacterium]